MNTVTLLTNSSYKASETFIMRQALALDAQIICKQNGDIEFGSNIKLKPPIILGEGKIVDSFKHKLLRKAGIRDNYGFSMIQIKQLEDYLKHSKSTTLLAQYGPNGIASAEIALQHNVNHVTHFHGYDLSSKLRQSCYRRDLVKLGRIGKKFIVVNSEQFEILLSLGYPRDNIHLIPCGVPIEEFRMKKRQVNQINRLVFVGRMVPKKDPLGLLKAFSIVLSFDSNASITMIGDGPLLSKCKEFVYNNSLSNNVRLLGVQSQEVVKKELQSAGIYVQHSITDVKGNKEGWPISIAEAAASGLPIVSTRHAGIMDQVIEGKTGYLVDEQDYEGFANRIVKLLRRPNQAIEFGIASQNHISKTGSLDEQLVKLKALI